jgi:lipoprotein-anchoring transpeptidase ErfK/SrfK
MYRMRRGAAAAGIVLVLGTACSGDDGDALDLSPPADSPFADIASDGGLEVRGSETYHVAVATGDTLVVRSAPQESADEVRTLSAADEVSGQVICLVAQELGDWVAVYTPSGPPGSVGWIERDDVTLSRHEYRIEIDRSAHTLTVYNGDATTLVAPVAIGPDAPAAGSNLYIKDLVQPPDPSGPYGTYAYGLSGSSNDFETFVSGQGVVALHGTNDPTALGRDVDRGAIALDAATVASLVETIGLPLGTPVQVVDPEARGD